MSYLSFSDAPGFDIYADRGPHLVRVCSVMIALFAIAVALRFLSRRLSKVRLSWDDWLILIALPVAWIPSILMIYCKNRTHTRTAQGSKSSSPQVYSTLILGNIYNGQQLPTSETSGSTFTLRKYSTQYLWSSSNARYCPYFTAYFMPLNSKCTLRRLVCQSSFGE